MKYSSLKTSAKARKRRQTTAEKAAKIKTLAQAKRRLKRLEELVKKNSTGSKGNKKRALNFSHEARLLHAIWIQFKEDIEAIVEKRSHSTKEHLSNE